MQTPNTTGNSRNRYRRQLGVVLIIAMLIIVCVLSVCFMKAPQNYTKTEDGTVNGGINVDTQNMAILQILPEYDFGGGLIAIVLCFGAFGLFVKYKSK